MVTLPDVASIDLQTEIRWFMRPYLLDFLIEAHAAYSLRAQTLFLAVNLLDRYCSTRVVYKRHYQLLGCAALLVAAKYGDRKDRVPTLRDLQSLCCATYDPTMFQQIEWHLLQTIDWVVGHPTVDAFLMIATAEDDEYDPELEHMALYIAEMALFNRQYVSVRPSIMARTTLVMAAHILGRPYIHSTRWAAEYDESLAYSLSRSMQQQQPSLTLSRKYASPKFSSVAVTLETFLAQVAAAEAAALAARTALEQPAMAATQMAPPPIVREAPQTPQKGAPQIPLGAFTPPITPDHDGQPNPVVAPVVSYASQLPITPSSIEACQAVPATRDPRYNVW